MILIVILISLYCFGVLKVRAMASDGLPDGEQAGPSCAQLGPLPGTFLGPALDIQSESLYELARTFQMSLDLGLSGLTRQLSK